MKNSNKYLVLDAARLGDKINDAQDMCPEFFSLYRGKQGVQLAPVAPYVFEVNIEIHDWYFKEGYGASWGIFLFCSQNIKQIRKHLRRFLLVLTEDNKELLFRFYDPRVLRIFLPTCNEEQLKEFFGPVDYFICEDENPEEAIVFSFKDNTLITKKIAKEEALNFNPAAKKKRFSFF